MKKIITGNTKFLSLFYFFDRKFSDTIEKLTQFTNQSIDFYPRKSKDFRYNQEIIYLLRVKKGAL